MYERSFEGRHLGCVKPVNHVLARLKPLAVSSSKMATERESYPINRPLKVTADTKHPMNQSGFEAIV